MHLLGKQKGLVFDYHLDLDQESLIWLNRTHLFQAALELSHHAVLQSVHIKHLVTLLSSSFGDLTQFQFNSAQAVTHWNPHFFF